MIARVETSSVLGIEAFPVIVEVDVSNGLPSFTIVGLPDTACRESQSRVRAAIKNSGFHFPIKKVTVNLAPADVRKEGSAFDLPIAVGILAASEQIEFNPLSNSVFAGELSLDGNLRSIPGVLSRVSGVIQTGKRFIFPHENEKEIAFLENSQQFPVKNLNEALHPQRSQGRKRNRSGHSRLNGHKERVDFSDVRGQAVARRGMEVAAAGGHNLLMVGPPGAGKTMLAKRLPTILSSLSIEETLETTKVHSVAGLLKKEQGLIEWPPFRAPHHTVSEEKDLQKTQYGVGAIEFEIIIKCIV